MPNTMPRWLSVLERKIGWIAIPNLALIFVTLQGLGFLMVMMNPMWWQMLILEPHAVMQGELWRLVTFLALPLSMSPIWVLFVLWFLYFILSSIESQWGAFQTTFYCLVGIVLSVIYSFAFGYPITQVSHFQSTLFLAAASLFPEYEIRLFLVFPVKMKWMAALTGVFVAVELFQGSWYDRGYLLAIYSNFLLFFGPAVIGRIKAIQRKKSFERKMRD